MPWMGPNKSYYYQSQRVNGRIVYTYYGAGEVAELIARYDQIEQSRREMERMDRDSFNAQAQSPAELDAYSAAVRATVADVLGRLGFHQHKRQWRRQRMNEIEKESVARRAADLFFNRKPTKAEMQEYKQLLNEHTAMVRTFGDLAVASGKMLLMVFKEHETMRVGASLRIDQLRTELGFEESTALERLLIDEIVLCWLDHYRIEISYAQQTKESFTLPALEQWEHVLTSKQRRYLRAVESLARVRRLLNLPGPQFNINMPGGQQVNVGEMKV
jgi:hypothetical protein